MPFPLVPRLAQATAVAAALLLVGSSPAFAGDASVTSGGADARYRDANDNLCALSGDLWNGSFAIADILRVSDRQVLFRVRDEQRSGPTCTGNLAIPEDVQYVLRVRDCYSVGGIQTRCSAEEKRFTS